MEKILTKRNTIIFVALVTLVRIYCASRLQLHPDEAYYWLWSRRLALGYFDHAPLVAFFIKLTTLFSQGELWVRFSAIVSAVVISVLGWNLSMQLFKREDVAAGSVVLLNVMPLTMSGSLLITPDIPAFLFWCAGIFIYWQIVETGRPAYWYLLGVAFGLALLSKYTSVLFAPVILLVMLLTEERRWLKTPYPYVALLIGLLLFMPVVYWNATHDWISFRFQFGHGLGGKSYSLGKVVEYLGGQMLVAGPLVWLAGMAAVTKYLFSRRKEELFLSLTSLPVLLFFAYSSLKVVAGPNWPAVAYFSFSIAASKFLLDGLRGGKAFWSVSTLVSFAFSALVLLHAAFDVIPLAKMNREWARADATNFFHGWRELGREISRQEGVKFILTPSHQLSAVVIYYTQERYAVDVDRKVTRPSQFNLWPVPPVPAGSGGLYVHVENEGPGPYQDYFTRFGDPLSLTVVRGGFPIWKFKLIPGDDYRHPAASPLPPKK